MAAKGAVRLWDNLNFRKRVELLLVGLNLHSQGFVFIEEGLRAVCSQTGQIHVRSTTLIIWGKGGRFGERKFGFIRGPLDLGMV